MLLNLLHIRVYIVVSFYLLQYIASLVPTYLYKSVNKLQDKSLSILKTLRTTPIINFPTSIGWQQKNNGKPNK